MGRTASVAFGSMATVALVFTSFNGSIGLTLGLSEAISLGFVSSSTSFSGMTLVGLAALAAVSKACSGTISTPSELALMPHTGFGAPCRAFLLKQCVAEIEHEGEARSMHDDGKAERHFDFRRAWLERRKHRLMHEVEHDGSELADRIEPMPQRRERNDRHRDEIAHGGIALGDDCHLGPPIARNGFSLFARRFPRPH